RRPLASLHLLEARVTRAPALLLTLVALGCQKTPTAPPEESAPVARPSPSAAPSAVADAATAIELGPRGLLDVVPKIPPFEEGVMDHAFAVGWSADGTTLGECHQGVVLSCEFLGLDGKKERVSV